LRKHPLYRALRSDKLRLAALEATLMAHRRGLAAEDVPVIQMLALSREEVGKRARGVIDQLTGGKLRVSFEDGESAVGGGAGPTCSLPTTLIAITHARLSAHEIERVLRSSSPPIIGRISEGKLLLDLRTVLPDELPELVAALKTID
jgi:L-seryl-tRNA(Ser) seleniumtransferase